MLVMYVSLNVWYTQKGSLIHRHLQRFPKIYHFDVFTCDKKSGDMTRDFWRNDLTFRATCLRLWAIWLQVRWLSSDLTVNRKISSLWWIWVGLFRLCFVPFYSSRLTLLKPYRLGKRRVSLWRGSRFSCGASSFPPAVYIVIQIGRA